MGVMQRNKGKNGEREVVNLFRAVHEKTGYVEIGTNGEPVEVGRNHNQAEKGGHDIVGVLGYAVEVKRVANRPTEGTTRVWWTQACAQAEQVNRLPLVVYRANHQTWRCLVEAALPWLHERYMADLEWKDFADYYEKVVVTWMERRHG